jgi:hypothetical protein
MPNSSSKINVYLEAGKKRVLAGVLGWPGWCRGGKDEESALQALAEYGPRYARAIVSAKLGFDAPKDVSAFKVVERLKGNATTDFGVPELATAYDKKPMTEADLKFYQLILKASWRAFDKAVEGAKGKELRKGPRGGGRELEGIIEHVTRAEAGYVTRLGLNVKLDLESLWEDVDQNRKAILDALATAVHDGQPAAGPRGGKIWTPRYFVSREAWHILDHVWEIEDRVEPAQG